MGKGTCLGQLSNVAKFLNGERKPTACINHLIEGIKAQMQAKEEV